MTDKTEMVRVETAAQTAEVAWLAGEIWREHYPPIIGAAHVEYMLAKFQTPAAIAEQMAGGYEYYLAQMNGRNEGYLAVAPGPGPAEAQLSKIYVRRQARSRGLGKTMLRFAESRCREKGLTQLWLRVNRQNLDSIGFYEKSGFQKCGQNVSNIGSGFVMDDYLMRKQLDTGHDKKTP